jgi:hypothetical protein
MVKLRSTKSGWLIQFVNPVFALALTVHKQFAGEPVPQRHRVRQNRKRIGTALLLCDLYRRLLVQFQFSTEHLTSKARAKESPINSLNCGDEAETIVSTNRDNS